MDTRVADFGVQVREIVDRALYRLNTCIPGVVETFDATTQTATVRPAIQMRTRVDGVDGVLDMPPIIRAPLVFPYVATAGFALTLPVQAGDPCLLLFSQRAIDNWHDLGGTQPPETGAVGSRHHDLTDALVLLAPAPIPAVLSGWVADGIELRNADQTSRITVRDAEVVVEVGPTTLTISSDGSVVLDAGDTVTVKAGGNVDIQAGGLSASKGVVQGDCICAYTGTPHPMVSATIAGSM